jgi:uncharacterized protein YndB with AHSA1/START domain
MSAQAPVPDEIRKELTIHATRQQVWAAITEPEQLKRWFPTHDATVDLRPGGQIYLEWEDMSTTGVFDEIDPLNRLVFRWHPAGDDHPSTSVEFTLTEAEGDDSTLLTVVERGFAQLPPESREGNVEGWTSELQELVDYLATLKPRH